MPKYLIRHWISADFIAEKIVDESEIEFEKNNLKYNSIPDGTFSFTMVKQSNSINRSTYELYDTNIRDSS